MPAAAHETPDDSRWSIAIHGGAGTLERARMTDQQQADFISKPGVADSAVVSKGAVAPIIGQEFVYSVSPPTGLSLKWGLSRYLDLLAKAAEKAAGQN